MGARNLALTTLAAAGAAGLTAASGGTAAPIALAGLTTAAGTGAALQQADQAEALSDYNASASKIEADAAQQQANEAAQLKQAEVRRIIARQRVAVAESGMLPSGSFADIQAETAAEGMRDARAILFGGRRARAAGLGQARLDRSQGRYARTAGQIGAATSLLSGAYQGYDMAGGWKGGAPPVYGPSNAARRGF